MRAVLKGRRDASPARRVHHGARLRESRELFKRQRLRRLCPAAPLRFLFQWRVAGCGRMPSITAELAMRVLRCVRALVVVLAFGVSLPLVAGPAEDAKAA